jgi:hypothetical protein
MTALVTATPLELIMHSQKSTNAWDGLAIATGAALKQEKCYAYCLIYRFTNGRASLGDIDDLPTPSCVIPQIKGPPLPSHLNVPLPNHSSAPIPTLSPSIASLLLGIWFGSSSVSQQQSIIHKQMAYWNVYIKFLDRCYAQLKLIWPIQLPLMTLMSFLTTRHGQFALHITWYLKPHQVQPFLDVACSSKFCLWLTGTKLENAGNH